VYMTKSSGPRTELWGTPQEEVCQEDRSVSHFTRKQRDDRYDLNQVYWDTETFENFGSVLRLAINATNFTNDFYYCYGYLGRNEVAFGKRVFPSTGVWSDAVNEVPRG